MSRGGSTRFRKGQSGNPHGRPKNPKPATSAFDIIIDRKLIIMQNGTERELSVEEALQQRTYQDALAGSRSARREVLRMIAKREKWLAGRQPVKPGLVEIITAYEGRTADEALLLLGIANEEPGPRDDQLRLKLEPWLIELGLQRGRRRGFSDKEITEIRRCTRDAQSIDWP